MSILDSRARMRQTTKRELRFKSQAMELFCVERVADFRAQLLDIERLGQKKHSRCAAIVGLERFLEISGNEKNLDVWVRGAERIGKFTPARLRHDQIGEEQIDSASAVFGEQAPRVIAIGGFDHFVTETAQHADR